MNSAGGKFVNATPLVVEALKLLAHRVGEALDSIAENDLCAIDHNWTIEELIGKISA